MLVFESSCFGDRTHIELLWRALNITNCPGPRFWTLSSPGLYKLTLANFKSSSENLCYNVRGYNHKFCGL